MQGWCLTSCKTKANEIMAAASTVHPDAVTRVVSPTAKCVSVCTTPKLAATLSSWAERCASCSLSCLTHISSGMCCLQACVIYRDYDDGPGGLQVADFVGKQNLDSMTSFLGGVHAYGGADECEDIAGGLRVSCTRLNKAHLPCPETELVPLHIVGELHHINASRCIVWTVHWQACHVLALSMCMVPTAYICMQSSCPLTCRRC